MVNVHEAKTHLSTLVQRVEAGETIVIARGGTPVAKLVPLTRGSAGRRRLGLLNGRMKVPDDFNRPLPAALLKAFEGLR